jgi:hypothetical protein
MRALGISPFYHEAAELGKFAGCVSQKAAQDPALRSDYRLSLDAD